MNPFKTNENEWIITKMYCSLECTHFYHYYATVDSLVIKLISLDHTESYLRGFVFSC